MKIAAYYARVSTNRQEKEETIESQIAELEERIKSDGSTLDEKNKFKDDGWSGELLERPALDQLRDAIKNKTFEVLYVYDLGRLSRNFLNQLILVEEIKSAEIELISLHDINAQTYEEVMAQRVMGVFHDYERVKIAERFRRGKIYKAQKGLMFNGSAAYGYEYIRKTNENEAHWIINEEEAENVRKIFHWVADERLTIRGVIKRLYELGITPKKKRRGAIWSNGPMCRLLRNEAYIGKAYYNKNYAVVPENPQNNDQYKRIKKSSRRQRPKNEWYLLPVPAILEDKLFYRVQEQLKLNWKFNKKNRKAKCLLPQKVSCICGRPRNIEGVREHRYYRCSDRIYRFPLPRQCNASGVNAFHLDDMVWIEVLKLFTNADLIREQASRWTDRQLKQVDNSQYDILSSEKLLKKLNEEEERYEKAYGAGVLTLEQLKERIGEVRLRKQAAQIEIRKTDEIKSKPVIDMAQIDNLPQRFSGMLQSFEFEEKQLFLRDVLGEVTVGDGSKVSVKGCIPLESEVQNNGLWTSGWDRRFTKRWKVDAV